MLHIMQHDQFKFPVCAPTADDSKKEKKSKKRKLESATTTTTTTTTTIPPPLTKLQSIPLDALEAARNMLGSEAGLVPEAFHLACVKNSEEERAETVYVSEAVGYKRNPNVKDKISSMKYEHGILTAEIASIKKKSEKIEGKLGVKYGGYGKKWKELIEGIKGVFEEIKPVMIDEKHFKERVER